MIEIENIRKTLKEVVENEEHKRKWLDSTVVSRIQLRALKAIEALDKVEKTIKVLKLEVDDLETKNQKLEHGMDDHLHY